MRLHGSVLSPFVQRVLFAARVKGIELTPEPVGPGGTQTDSFAAKNPMRRVPVLEEDDGWTLAESAAIVAYLDEIEPGPSLLPAGARDAAKARMIAAIVDNEVAAGLRHFVIQSLFRMHDTPALLDYGREQLNKGLDAIEALGIGDGWVVGDAPSVADATFVPLLALADLIARNSDAGPLVSGRPGVDAYCAFVRETPLGARTLAEMNDAFAALVAARQ